MFGVVKGDVQTTTGQNIRMLRMETSLDPTIVNSAAIRKALVEIIPPVPEVDRWRLKYLGLMLEMRGEAHYAGKDTALITSLIDSLCSS